MAALKRMAEENERRCVGGPTPTFGVEILRKMTSISDTRRKQEETSVNGDIRTRMDAWGTVVAKRSVQSPTSRSVPDIGS